MPGSISGKKRTGQPTAVCLLSGGLDSALAAKLILEQGVRVMGVHFVIPFGRYGKEEADLPVRRVARSLGIEVEVVALGEEYLGIVRHPEHGYGANVNPCIDCRIYMLRKAAAMMRDARADFIVTGEVVGQRPMSQRMDTMRKIEKESGLEGYLVRPLSAHLLAPTRPELEGLVRRDDLIGVRVHGRSRRDLLDLAEKKGVSGFASPGGGCLLTDPKYAQRVRDLLRFDMLTLHDIDLLSVGRHFRLPHGAKLAVGRHKRDNDRLAAMAEAGDIVLTTPAVPGPTAVLNGPGALEDQSLAGRIVARYSDAAADDKVRIGIVAPSGVGSIEVTRLDPRETAELMV
jgi:tRNA-specific 2-thiouridylase